MNTPVRLALIAGSAAWAVSGAPEAGADWTAPLKVSAVDVSAGAPEVDVDDAGSVTVVWVSGAPGSIRSAYRPAGGAWESSSERVHPIFDCHDPQLAVNPAGAAVAVADCGTGTATMRAAYRPAGGSWAASVVLPGSGSGSEPRVGLDDAGNAVVVWASAGTVQSAYRPAAGGWAGATQVSPAGDVTLEPQVAMSPTGAALAIWRHELDRSPTDPVVTVEVSIRHGGGPWSAPSVRTPAATSTIPVAEYEPQVRWNRTGKRLAVWANRTTPERALLQKTYGTSDFGGWGGGTSLIQDASDGVTSVEAPQAALDGAGRAVAVWRSYNGAGFRTQASMTASPDGIWSAPVFLADVETGLAEPQVAVAPGGNAAAVWRTSSARISAATRPPGGAFLPATTISSGDSTGAAAPRVVMTTAGDAIAAWSESTMGPTRIAVSVDDVTPPVLSAIAVPAGVEAGAAAAMSAAAADAWSPVTVAWELGDGTTIAGEAISHTYAAAGTRTVTVTATDAAGNAAAATREIVVTQAPGGAGPVGGHPGGGLPAGGGPAPTPVTLGVTVPRQSWRAIRKAKAVKLRCTLDVAGGCKARATVTRSLAERLRLELDDRARTLRVGRGSVTIASGGRATRLEVALGRRVRRAIGRTRRRVALTLKVTGSAPGRASTTLTRRLTIRRR